MIAPMVANSAKAPATISDDDNIELPPPVRREHPVELPEPAPETDLILR